MIRKLQSGVCAEHPDAYAFGEVIHGDYAGPGPTSPFISAHTRAAMVTSTFFVPE